MQCRVIHSARLRIALAKGKMNRSTHLLIKQHILGAAINPRIIAKSEFTEIACASIHIQHMLKVCLSLASTCLDYFPCMEYQAHPFNCATIMRCWDIKLNHTISTILHWPGKELAAGKVAFPIAVDKRAILYRERQVCPISLDTHSLLPNKPIHQPLLLYRQVFPASNGIFIIEETHIDDKFFKVVQGHFSILRVSSGGIQRR